MVQQREASMLELKQRIAVLEARELATQKYLAEQAQHLTIARTEAQTAQAKVGLLTTIAQVTNLLLKAENYKSVLPNVVRLLGEAVGSDRTGIALQDAAANTEIQTTITVQGTPYPLPCDIGRNLLRIAQEAITNCLRHAQASAINLTIQFNADSIDLEI